VAALNYLHLCDAGRMFRQAAAGGARHFQQVLEAAFCERGWPGSFRIEPDVGQPQNMGPLPATELPSLATRLAKAPL
jgi:hypothetical protein